MSCSEGFVGAGSKSGCGCVAQVRAQEVCQYCSTEHGAGVAQLITALPAQNHRDGAQQLLWKVIKTQLQEQDTARAALTE